MTYSRFVATLREIGRELIDIADLLDEGGRIDQSDLEEIARRLQRTIKE